MTAGEVPSIKRILVPIDGSPVSKKAAQYAIHLAKLEHDKIVVMHVLEGVKQGGAIGLQAKYGNLRMAKGLMRIKEQAAEKWIAEIKEMADRQHVRMESEIMYDDGTEEAGVIINYAKKHDMDLIVMGSKGRSRLKRLLLGGVTNAVVNLAPCPVLIVR
jgi:nucleotide-binding universal stress UspA family protein